MTSTLLRQYIIIIGGIGITTWLVVSTIRQIRPQVSPQSISGRMPVLVITSRLAFGAMLMLIAVSLVAGQMFSVQSATTATTAWLVALGAVLLVIAALSGIVVGVFIVVRWRQPRV